MSPTTGPVLQLFAQSQPLSKFLFFSLRINFEVSQIDPETLIKAACLQQSPSSSLSLFVLLGPGPSSLQTQQTQQTQTPSLPLIIKSSPTSNTLSVISTNTFWALNLSLSFSHTLPFILKLLHL